MLTAQAPRPLEQTNAEGNIPTPNSAVEQGAYWAYNEKLFSGEFPLGEDAYQKYAEQLRLDTNRFDKCLSSGEQEDEVMADFSYAFQLGVRITPTFFLNGIPIVGPQPFDIFKQIIDKELAGELP